MFIPTHAKWISPPVCLAPLSTGSFSSLLKSNYPACCSLSISPSASWLLLMSVPNWVWPPVHPGPAWLVTHLRSHPFAALSSPSLAALQLQGSADRENVINPIQIKRGYDKWWALALSSVISTIIISLNNFFVDFERPWPGLSLPILMVTITFEGLI